MRIELKLRIRNSLEVSDHVHKFHSVSHLVFHGGMKPLTQVLLNMYMMYTKARPINEIYTIYNLI